MKIKAFLGLSFRGISIILFHSRRPLIGSIIVTDRCNLSCRHCAVNNVTSVIYPYVRIREDMRQMFEEGVRILFFYGGEPFLWRDSGRNLRNLVIEAKRIGFIMVGVVTNGTFPLNIPEADWLMVSLDGGREKHNAIRGDTYDRIMKNIERASSDRICLYMAINQINKGDIERVCETAKRMKNVRAVSFNFHTPYPGTEYLMLSKKEKRDCCKRIAALMDRGYPILNLRSAFPYVINNTFEKPCRQCIIVENDRQWTCGRCIEVEGLCSQCGFLFAAEYSLVFGGNLKAISDMVRTYVKYI